MVECEGRPGSTAVTTPAFERIEADLRRRIAAGEWPAGTRLPRLADLCEQYEVSEQPVRRALERLEIAGLVVRRQGGAAIVAEREA